MKFKSEIFLLVLSVVALFSCNRNTQEQKEVEVDKTESIQLKEEVLKLALEPIDNVTKFRDLIIESMFFECRSDYNIQINEKDFILYEHIDFDGSNLDYLIVTIPEYNLLSFNSDKTNTADFSLDTIRYVGLVKVKELEDINDVAFDVIFDGEWHSNSISRSPYTREEQNYFVDDEYFKLRVNSAEKKNYNRDELYLKLRFVEFQNADLSEFSKEDLAYLRNEIFARHGHIFKTTKMKSYFETQSWYRPYSNDATPYLNEIEKKNVSLIKNLESQL